MGTKSSCCSMYLLGLGAPVGNGEVVGVPDAVGYGVRDGQGEIVGYGVEVGVIAPLVLQLLLRSQ